MRTQVAEWLRATADLIDNAKPPVVKVDVKPTDTPNLAGLAMDILTAHLRKHGVA